MPIVTDSSDVRLGVGPPGGHGFTVTSKYEFCSSSAPIYDLLLVRGPSLHLSSVYDTLRMYAYSILPRRGRDCRFEFDWASSFDLWHGLFAKFSMLSPTIPFSLVQHCQLSRQLPRPSGVPFPRVG